MNALSFPCIRVKTRTPVFLYRRYIAFWCCSRGRAGPPRTRTLRARHSRNEVASPLPQDANAMEDFAPSNANAVTQFPAPPSCVQAVGIVSCLRQPFPCPARRLESVAVAALSKVAQDLGVWVYLETLLALG